MGFLLSLGYLTSKGGEVIKVWYSNAEIEPVREFWVIKQITELFFPWHMAEKNMITATVAKSQAEGYVMNVTYNKNSYSMFPRNGMP